MKHGAASSAQGRDRDLDAARFQRDLDGGQRTATLEDGGCEAVRRPAASRRAHSAADRSSGAARGRAGAPTAPVRPGCAPSPRPSRRPPPRREEGCRRRRRMQADRARRPRVRVADRRDRLPPRRGGIDSAALQYWFVESCAASRAATWLSSVAGAPCPYACHVGRVLSERAAVLDALDGVALGLVDRGWRADAASGSAHTAAETAMSAVTLRRASGPRRLLLMRRTFVWRWIPPWRVARSPDARLTFPTPAALGRNRLGGDFTCGIRSGRADRHRADADAPQAKATEGWRGYATMSPASLAARFLDEIRIHRADRAVDLIPLLRDPLAFVVTVTAVTRSIARGCSKDFAATRVPLRRARARSQQAARVVIVRLDTVERAQQAEALRDYWSRCTWLDVASGGEAAARCAAIARCPQLRAFAAVCGNGRRLRQAGQRFALARVSSSASRSGFAATPVPALATFPGANGRIAFASAANGNFDIHTMNPDGTGTVDVADVSRISTSSPTTPTRETKIAFRAGRADAAERPPTAAGDAGLPRQGAKTQSGSSKRRQKGEDSGLGREMIAGAPALGEPESPQPSRFERLALEPKTPRFPRVVQEVRVGVAPQNRKSRTHAGFRPSKWRDPDSNRGHHDFQSCDPGWPGARNPWNHAILRWPELRREVRYLRALHGVQEIEASHRLFSPTP